MESDSIVIDEECILTSETLKTELDSQKTQPTATTSHQQIASNSSFTGSNGTIIFPKFINYNVHSSFPNRSFSQSQRNKTKKKSL